MDNRQEKKKKEDNKKEEKNYTFILPGNQKESKQVIFKPGYQLPFTNTNQMVTGSSGIGKIAMPSSYQPLSQELRRSKKDDGKFTFVHEPGSSQHAPAITNNSNTRIQGFPYTQDNITNKPYFINPKMAVPAIPQPHHFAVPNSYLAHLKHRFPINPVHKKEVESLSKQFSFLQKDYYLFDKIGEGTFSSVYKGVDIKYDLYDNSQWDLFDDADDELEEFGYKEIPPPPPSLVWDLPGMDNRNPMYLPPNQLKRNKLSSAKYKLVAVKKIYVTSSCQRIENEIELLSILSGHPNIVSLITAIRHEDQIIAITPYYRHHDFRETFLFYTFQDMQNYMRCLLKGLRKCHQFKIIHRDVKPSNFLYHMTKKRGQLADFGLAQRTDVLAKDLNEEQQEPGYLEPPRFNDPNIHNNKNIPYSYVNERGIPGVLKNDIRPSIRANRAGTRGFRAPEVLFKVVNQTAAIDIWSAGVILLCMLSRRFPFFNSPTDHDALVEIGIIFGKKNLQKLALSFGKTFETNVPTVTDHGISFEELLHFSNPSEYSAIPYQAIDLLKRLLKLHPNERISAEHALQHPFLAE